MDLTTYTKKFKTLSEAIRFSLNKMNEKTSDYRYLPDIVKINDNDFIVKYRKLYY